MTDDECAALVKLTEDTWAAMDVTGQPRLHVARRPGETTPHYAVRLVRVFHHAKMVGIKSPPPEEATTWR